MTRKNVKDAKKLGLVFDILKSAEKHCKRFLELLSSGKAASESLNRLLEISKNLLEKLEKGLEMGKPF